MVAGHFPDYVQRALTIYENQLKDKLENTHCNEYVAIEADSGDYYVAKTHSEVVAAARKAHPDRLSLVLRIGHQGTFHIGSGI
jgi:hypothetical protein